MRFAIALLLMAGLVTAVQAGPGKRLSKDVPSSTVPQRIERDVRIQMTDRHIESLNAGEPIEIIVEYEHAASDQAIDALRSAQGLVFDSPALLEQRAQGYRASKDKVIAAVMASAPLVQDLSHLPMSIHRVSSIDAVDAVARVPGVKAVYASVEHEATLAESLPLIGQPAAYNLGATGAGTAVAVLDTGVDYTRAAFGSCSAPGGSCKVAYSADIARNDGSLDDVLHGTNVSAIVLGVAPLAKIVALDVFAVNSSGKNVATSTDLVTAMNWVIANRSTYNIVAMNMSLGDSTRNTGACTTNYAVTAIATAKAAGIATVIASGNDAYKDGIAAPACAPGAISVGAVYDSAMGSMGWAVGCTDPSTAADMVTCFSNSSSLLTLLAPGSVITAANISMSGTSQATPHVAGAFAALRSKFASDTVDATRDRLISTGRAVTDVNGITKPRIDLARAAAGTGQFSLTVSKNGSGSGTVTSAPAGINCGSACAAAFSSGTVVSLTATPASGSTFAGWSGGCTGAGGCALTLNATQSVTATFAPVSASISLATALDNASYAWTTGGSSPWAGQSVTWRVGGSSAKSGVLADSQSNYVQATIAGPGVLSWYWKVSSEYQYDFSYLYVDGQAVWSYTGEGDWYLTTQYIPSGYHAVRWTYEKDSSVSSGADAAWVDAVSFTPTPDDNWPPNGAMPALWERPLSASASWNVATDSAYAGSASLKSGVIGDNQATDVQYVADFSASGTVRFARRVSSEESYDFLQFFIDGVKLGEWSGETGWDLATYALTAGRHTLTWRYVKDISVSVGLDAAWIDSVSLPPNTGISLYAPNAFSFAPKSPVPLSSPIVSDAVTITGQPTAAPVSVANGSVSIGCTGTFTNAPGSIVSGQTICVMHTSASTYSTITTTTVTIGGRSGTFSSTTLAAGTTVVTVARAGNGSGTVTSSSGGLNCGAACSGSVATGTSITLTATPAAGSTFAGWSGDCTGGLAACTLVMNVAKTVTATFNLNTTATVATRYRLYSPGTREHLFTTNNYEYRYLTNQVDPSCCGWAGEGAIYRVLTSPGSFNGVAAVPYYRLYNPYSYQHHWTVDAFEYAFLKTVGWQQEGLDGYILPSPVAGAVPLYRLNINAFGGLHLWTTDTVERSYLVTQAGWFDEGIAGYVIPLP